MPEALPSAPVSQPAAAPVAGTASILARRYAVAFYELATERQQLDAVAADLRLLRGWLRNSDEFRSLAAQPRLTRAQLVGAMQAVTQAAQLTPLTGNFLALVAQNRRLTLTGAIIDAFLAQLAAKQGEFSAEVRSAQKLTPAQMEKLAASLRELAGGKVHLTLEEDPALLGGLTVRLGSKLIDASMRTKLQHLGRQLISPASTPHKGAA